MAASSRSPTGSPPASWQVDWALRVDTLTAVMLVVVTTVSFLVHIYSIGYMREDPSRQRFFAYLSLFTFAMLMLVTADNLVQMFFGWEGVGLASYLLIGFWYEKPSANAAAIKAFVVNRVGDFGFALGIFLVFVLTGSVSFEQIFAAAPGLANKSIHVFGIDADAMTVACLLLFMGAMGKSAQFLLHTWLPDAMEGPTPVSALIHAATMVTAGVFMVARLSPLFELVADRAQRRDRRRRRPRRSSPRPSAWCRTTSSASSPIRPARSSATCSSRSASARYRHRHLPSVHPRLLQGAAVPRRRLGHQRDASRAGHARDGRPEGRDPVHLLDDDDRHAGADRRRHSVHADRLRRLRLEGRDHRGGLRFRIAPARCSPSPAVIAAALTSFYSWRLVFMTFFGKRGDWSATLPAAAHGHDDHGHDDHGHDDHGHDDHGHHPAHESPRVMLIPLAVLAVGAAFAGVLFRYSFIGSGVGGLLESTLFVVPKEDPGRRASRGWSRCCRP